MSDKDQIKELFSQKMGGYEAKVNPELWTNIASQVGTSTVAGSTGMSLLAKVVIGVSAASVLTTAVVLMSSSDKEETKKQEPTTEFVDNKQEKSPTKNSVVVENTQPENSEAFVINENQQEPVSASQESTEQNSSEETASQTETSSSTAESTTSASSESQETTENGTDNNTTVSNNTQSREDNQQMLENPKAIVHTEDEPTNTTETTTQTEEKTPLEIELPNVITPNGDNVNDYLSISAPRMNSFYIEITDQNGKKVFESNDVNFKWNATNMYTGEQVINGIHHYIVIAEDEEGRVFKGSQYLMVITN